MRYILVPGPVRLLDPISEKETGEVVTFAQAMRGVCASLIQGQALDALSVLDLRDKINKAVPGQYVELTEDEYRALEPEWRRPKALQAVYVLSAQAHIRAVLDAAKDRPAAMDVAVNGLPALFIGQATVGSQGL